MDPTAPDSRCHSHAPTSCNLPALGLGFSELRLTNGYGNMYSYQQFYFCIKSKRSGEPIAPTQSTENSGNTDLLDDGILELLGASPLPDAGQAIRVVAVGEDPKPPLGGRWFLIHHFHADAAHLVLTGLKGKGLLHVVLKRRHAHLSGERHRW